MPPLDLEATDYAGTSQLYEISIANDKGERRDMGIVADDLESAISEALDFLDEYEPQQIKAEAPSPVKYVVIYYEQIDEAPRGIFHGGTKECHPAFDVTFGTHSVGVRARAVTWAHLFELNDSVPFVLYSSDST